MFHLCLSWFFAHEEFFSYEKNGKWRPLQAFLRLKGIGKSLKLKKKQLAIMFSLRE